MHIAPNDVRRKRERESQVHLSTKDKKLKSYAVQSSTERERKKGVKIKGGREVRALNVSTKKK